MIKWYEFKDVKDIPMSPCFTRGKYMRMLHDFIKSGKEICKLELTKYNSATPQSVYISTYKTIKKYKDLDDRVELAYRKELINNKTILDIYLIRKKENKKDNKNV